MERKVSARLFVALFAAVFALGIAPCAAFAAPSGNLAGASPQGGIAVQDDGDNGDDDGDDDWDYSYYKFEIAELEECDTDEYVWDGETIGIENILVKKDGEQLDLEELGYSVKLYKWVEIDGEDTTEEIFEINSAGSYELALVDKDGEEVANDTVILHDPYSLDEAYLYINGEHAWDWDYPTAIPEGDVEVVVYPPLFDDEYDPDDFDPLVPDEDYELSFEDEEGHPVEAGKFKVGTVYFAVAKEVEDGDYTGECRAAFMLYGAKNLDHAEIVLPDWIDDEDDYVGIPMALSEAAQLSAADVKVYACGELVDPENYALKIVSGTYYDDEEDGWVDYNFESVADFNAFTEAGYYRLFVVASEKGKEAGYTDAGEDLYDNACRCFEIYADNDLGRIADVTDVWGMIVAKGQQLPAVTVEVEGKTLVKGTDYDIEYYQYRQNEDTGEEEWVKVEGEPSELGTYGITVVGKGSYTGEYEAGKFEIVEPNSLKLATVKVEAQGKSKTFPIAHDSDEYELLLDYTGEVIEPKFTVMLDGKELPLEKLEISVSHEDGGDVIKDRGWYWVTIYGGEEYTDWVQFNIRVATIVKDEDITIEEGPFKYSGEPIEPQVVIKVGDQTLVENDDYSVDYSDNNKPGIGTVSVEGSSGYIINTTRTFVITDLGEDATEEEKAKATADAEAAKAVVDMINALAYEVETDAEKEAVDAAKAAYDKLTDDQKALIGEVAKEQLDDAIDSAKWYAIDAVEAAIQALPETVASDADKAAVDAAKAAYDKLTDEQKAFIGSKALSKLNNAVKSAESYKPAKKANTMTAKAKAVKAKAKKLKKKAQKIAAAKAIAVGNPQGNVTYKLKSVKAKKKLQKQAKKKIKMASNGQITLKKKLKKGTYTLTVDVTAAGNADYNAVTKTVTVKIKVK